ncbi:MAG: DUF559 domain-containing protein [Candidatus Pacebacteria bacterium]|nr:DUF559 domain-containing protein [Candidatus Paceibacterota bacterium]
MHHRSTPEALALKSALEDEGVIVEVEKFDGFKRVDLAIPRARLYIEVDGIHHYTNHEQILADLGRSHYSALDGFSTIHIPNEIIRSHLERIAAALAKASKVRAARMGHRFAHAR